MALPVSLMLLLILLIFRSITLVQLAAAAANNNSSFLHLSPGLHLSMLPSLNASTVGIPTLSDEGSIFLPILSSPSFNYTTSNASSQSPGFSLGFYFSDYTADHTLTDYTHDLDYNIYMAVCAGSSGNYVIKQLDSGNGSYVNNTSGNNIYLRTRNGSYLSVYPTVDGLVVPVWIANLHRPIKYVESASLRVDSVNGSSSNMMELRLMDDDEVVWNVSNISTARMGNNIVMEMQDSGKLVIYDDSVSSSTTKPVLWQSPMIDMLLEGQMLKVGAGELTSNDSSYSAKMEKGGLVLYINTVHFNLQQGLQATPYWIFPLIRSPVDDELKLMSGNDMRINQLINSAPCSNSSAYAVINHTSDAYVQLYLLPGISCSHDYYYAFSWDAGGINVSWSFLRLENDGRLYSYAVSNPIGAASSATRSALARSALSWSNLTWTSVTSSQLTALDQWPGECDVPMACGPAGLCTPGAKSFCSCQYADNSFEPINGTDYSQGCKRTTLLPPCSISGNDHLNSTDFVQLNSTASIFLFTGWTFNSTQYAPHVDACKHSCSSSCSCLGFFYQVDISGCFFITENISMLTVEDQNYSFYAVFEKEILARNYVTYLKVATAAHDEPENKATSIALIVILPSIVACVAFGLAGYLLVRGWIRKRVQMRMHAREENELRDILPLLPSRFSYKGLHEATKGFSNLLGAGGCGSVYAGILADGRNVAVKVLQIVGAGQSKQFLAEVATVGRTSHHNIVRLLGFCWEVSNRLLVYEYVERGSLDRWLFLAGDSTTAAPLLDWETRYKVALGIAQGLHYLHEECEQPILHFDIKPQNILLGDKFVAKLADFGMSRNMQKDVSAVVTGVRGTPGYIAPEWLSHGTGSKKSDVYSTGMVMLEILGGRKILDYSLLDSEEQEAWHFPSWAAKKCEQGLLMEVVDKRLHVCGFDGEQARRLIHIAFWCIHDNPVVRPNAATLVHWLGGDSLIEQPSFSTSGIAAQEPSRPYSHSD